MLGFLRRHCTQLTNIHCRRLLYLTLVRSHLSYGSEIWSPQGSSRDLVLIEGIQRRATKFITQDYHSSYSSRLKSLRYSAYFANTQTSYISAFLYLSKITSHTCYILLCITDACACSIVIG